MSMSHEKYTHRKSVAIYFQTMCYKHYHTVCCVLHKGTKVRGLSLHSGKPVLPTVHITITPRSTGHQFSFHIHSLTVLSCCLVGAWNLSFRHDLLLPSLVPFFPSMVRRIGLVLYETGPNGLANLPGQW